MVVAGMRLGAYGPFNGTNSSLKPLTTQTDSTDLHGRCYSYDKMREMVASYWT